jgi:hypothetical protein
VEKATPIIEVVEPEVRINKQRIRRKARIEGEKSESVEYCQK